MIGRLAVTILIGILAGLAAQALGLPLPWMIGPLLAAGLAAFAGARLVMLDRARDVMIAVIGVLLGGAFDPGVFNGAGRWAATLAAMVVCTLVMMIVAPLVLSRLFGHKPINAFLSGMPGALSQVVALSAASGADMRAVAIAHTVRVMTILLAAPVVILLLFSDAPAIQPGAAGWPATRELLLLAVCLAGFPLARLMRLPSAPLIGPTILSGVLHYTGVVTSDPPFVVIAAAQMVLGTSIAIRFGGADRRLLSRSLAAALVTTAVLVAISAIAALLAWRFTDLPLMLLLLAFIPGGTSEIVLVTIALQQDPAFVSLHHLLRIVLVLAIAPVVMPILVNVSK